MRGSIRLAVLGIGCALIGPSRAQDSAPSKTPVAVPFQLASHFLVVVAGQVGDVSGLKFIVDTAATRSVIDRKLAAQLDLRRHTGKIMNFDRYIPIEWADVPELRMGPLRATDLRIMVVDLAEYSEFTKTVDGIIGLDLLSRTDKLTIDYGEKRLYVELRAKGTSSPAIGCFVVPIVVQGIALRLAVDTGLSDILLYGDRLKRRPLKIRTEGEPQAVVMGRVRGKRVTLPGVQLGGPEEPITVVLIDGPTEPTMLGLDGYLGIASLHPSRIEFDFAKMSLRWQ
jgi:predicted aspartyl protease